MEKTLLDKEMEVQEVQVEVLAVSRALAEVELLEHIQMLVEMVRAEDLMVQVVAVVLVHQEPAAVEIAAAQEVQEHLLFHHGVKQLDLEKFQDH